jgi:hypothetical protein
MSKYSKGLINLIEKQPPPENEVYLLMQISCPKSFYDKYKRLMKINNRYSGLSKLLVRGPNTKANFLKKFVGLADMEMPQPIQDLSDREIKDLMEKVSATEKYMSFTRSVFETNDSYEDKLISALMNKYSLDKGLKVKEKIPECYDLYTSKAFDRLKKPYYEYGFDDFILNVFRIIRFYTRLSFSMELSSECKLYIKIYAKNDTFNYLAEYFDYDLQLKPYALKFSEYIKKIKLDKLKENETDALFFENLDSPTLQFHQLDQNEPSHFPPYFQYQIHRNLKYRRYLSNDEFHDCPMDPEFNDYIFTKYRESLINHDEASVQLCEYKCSKFRNIDKLRIINRALEKTIKLNLLNKISDLIIYKRNFMAYKDELTTNSLMWSSANIFNIGLQMKLIQTIRNFYGEKISYYFLFLLNLNLWLIFPMILGIITFFIESIAASEMEKGDIQTMGHIRINYADLTLFIFSFLITIWANLFINVWAQKETLFNYLWGMENLSLSEPNQEEFENEENINFIFNEQIPIYPAWKRNLKIFVSYLVVTFMVGITAVLSFLLFRLRADKVRLYPDGLFWPIVVASLNALQIRTMTIIYDYIARRLTRWENYEKKSQIENANAIKFIIFEFVNHYIALYYIAFLRPYLLEKCVDDNCLKEIEVQLYVILLLHFIFNMIGLAIPYAQHKWRESKLKEAMRSDIDRSSTNLYNLGPNEDIQIVPHSIEHQIICDEVDSLIDEYNELVILFGYVCFFGVAAPLTPTIIFLLTYLEKYTDSYKLFYLCRLAIVEGSPGIEIYNLIFRVFYFIGMLTNIGIVLFTNPHLIDVAAYKDIDIRNNQDFIVKFIIFAILENILLLLMRFINYNILPKCKFSYNFRV